MRRAAIVLAFLAVACGGKRGAPDIETSCTMNGFGSGSCSYTNKGTGAGAQCGRIMVLKTIDPGDQEAVASSSEICSGSVEVKTTKTVPFDIPDVREVCDPPDGKNWHDICQFDFVTDDELAK